MWKNSLFSQAPAPVFANIITTWSLKYSFLQGSENYIKDEGISGLII